MYDASPVWSCLVVLWQDSITYCSCICIKDVISTNLKIYCSIWKDMVICASAQRDSTLNTDTASFVCISSMHVWRLITVSRFSPYQIMRTIAFLTTPRLICKENSPTYVRHPVDMLSSPLQTIPPMASHERHTNGWSSRIQTTFVKPSTYSWRWHQPFGSYSKEGSKKSLSNGSSPACT